MRWKEPLRNAQIPSTSLASEQDSGASIGSTSNRNSWLVDTFLAIWVLIHRKTRRRLHLPRSWILASYVDEYGKPRQKKTNGSTVTQAREILSEEKERFSLWLPL
jgi:hypothetical protein